MPVRNVRSDGRPMIVDHMNIDEEIVVPQMAALEADLFGRGAWSEQSIRQEFHAPARTYLFDIDDFGIVDCAAADRPGADGFAAKQPVVRGYAGFWYDGDDAEIMTIGVGKQFQRRGIAASLMEALIARAREQGRNACCLKCASTIFLPWHCMNGSVLPEWACANATTSPKASTHTP